ncbi:MULTISPECIES: tyrosine-type recombinase/integrase [unclassified Isoptericola]|uniref:tyrosine-type recombinase/integrase n=1 Tax=unclassified Isoptericola TaxID=2623355 RepID=UPI0036552F49
MARPRIPIGTHGDIHYEESDTGRITAVTIFRDFDGRNRKVRATGQSRSEAKRNLNAKLARKQLASGSGDLTADSLFTVLAEAWLEHLDETNKLAVSTRYRYERDLRTLVLPALENFTLREITVRRVDRMLQDLNKRSYNRAQKAKVVLNLCFKLAVRWEVVDRNPVRDVATLEKPVNETKALSLETVEQIRALVAAWQAGAGYTSGPRPDGQVLAVIETMLGTSARIGEVLALRRQDVDLVSEHPSVTIAGTVISIDKGRTFRQDHPKTARSTRTVFIPKFAATALAARLARIGDVAPDHLVFFTRTGTPISTNNFRRTLRRVLQGTEAEGVTPHAFRRTVATTVERAVGIDLAAELLGHTSTEITRVHYIEPNQYVDSTTAVVLQRSLRPGAEPMDPTAPRGKRTAGPKKSDTSGRGDAPAA